MNYKELLGSNYREDMTPEEILEALGQVNIETETNANDDEVQRLKAAVSKANKEAADYKKQLNAKLTEEEQSKIAEQEAREELQAAYNALLRESQISKNTAKFIGLGYDEKLATQTAEALIDGNLDVVFANQTKFNSVLESKIKAEVLNSTPRPNGGDTDKSYTIEDLRKMTTEDRINFAQTNPEQYKQIYGGNE